MAPIFRLEQFPNVCRLCLKAPNSQPMHSETMVPINQTDPVFGGKSIKEYIAAYTFYPISEENNDLLPRIVCMPCLDQLKAFSQYYTKICVIQWLMNSLAELKRSNSIPLVNLFHYRSDLLRMVFKDLNLCTTDNYSLDDLWKEFPRITETASTSVQTEEHVRDAVIRATNAWKDGQMNLDVTYAKEDTPDEVIDLHKPITNSAEDKPTFKKGKSSMKSNDDANKINSSHVKQNKFICEICQVQVISENDLKQHKAHHHLETLGYESQSRGRVHNTELELRSHVKGVPFGSIVCIICGQNFENESLHTAHILTHRVANFPCDMCDEKYTRIDSLRNHIENVHGWVRFFCRYCSKTCTNKHNLDCHIESVHKDQMRFVCDVCVECFDNQEKLDNHKARHKAPKALECGTCLNSFHSADGLANHMCINYRDDYVCCGRDWCYHLPYNKHMLQEHATHTNARVKPIPEVLKERMLPKKVWACSNCGETSASRKRKKQHKKSCNGLKGEETAQILPDKVESVKNADLQ